MDGTTKTISNIYTNNPSITPINNLQAVQLSSQIYNDQDYVGYTKKQLVDDVLITYTYSIAIEGFFFIDFTFENLGNEELEKFSCKFIVNEKYISIY